MTAVATEPAPTRATDAPGHRWTLVHAATLVVGAAALAWINRDQWLKIDEWVVVTRSGLGSNPTRDGLLTPHFEHWSTLGVLVYKAIYGVFALRTYVPYLAVLIVLLVALAHVTWRLLLRIGVVPGYATAVAALTMVLAESWENRSNPWQITIVAPVALGFGALLLMPERGAWRRRDLGVSGLLLVGLMCSGVGVTMTIVVTVAALLRRGWRVTLAIVGGPAAVFGLWYLFEGTSGQRNTSSLSEALGDLPDFVWRGLTAAFDGLTRVPDTGVFVLAALVVWLVWRARPRREPWPLVVATTCGSLASIALTGLRRSGVGSVPGAPRYSDIVVLLALPALALATQELGRALVVRFGRAALVTCSIVVIGFLVLQAVDLDHEVNSQPFEGEMKPRVLAVARIMRDREPIAAHDIFGIFYIQEPSTSTIARLDRNGELPAIDVSLADVLTARQYVETVIGGAAKYPEGRAEILRTSGATTTDTAPGCVAVAPARASARPRVVVRVPGESSIRVATPVDTEVPLSLVEGHARGRPRRFPVGPPGAPISTSRTADMQLTFPAGTTSTVCGVATAASESS